SSAISPVSLHDALPILAGHAAMALQSSQLFTRIEQANRHSNEIFDAISDFIVVHDEADRVVRVNRSLAAMIGVPQAELLGVNMRSEEHTSELQSPYDLV